LGFLDSQLITYQSPEECNELFIKGSVNGGIDVAFDEAPYLKHFLGTYSCSKYVMVEPRFKTGGFGYASCFNPSLPLSFEQCFKI
jgi:ionotropic glutamate receptor